MAKTITAAAVKNYRPGEGRREIPDGGCPGLYLVIQASGHRSWAMRFRRPNGKPAKLTLGPVDLSGKEAESEPVRSARLADWLLMDDVTTLRRLDSTSRLLILLPYEERLQREAQLVENHHIV